ncbi:cytochrome P450 [Serendipita vermifera]|nr:cytochrome P450 [Serendipita vermifera]
MDIVILNSHEIAQELLSKRPSSTAGRQVGYFVADLMNWGWNIGLIQAGPSHSNQRKMLRKSIGPQRISSYYDMIETEMAKLTTVLHKTEGNPADVIKRALTRMVTKATYGEKLWDDMGDILSERNLEAMDIANEHFFAFWLVDIIPLLRFVPSWFPGAHFQRIAQRSRYLVERIRYRAYKRVQELYNAGTLGHCIANDLMAEFGPNEDARDALAMLPVASDATTAAVIAFFHAMFLFPDIAERVFEEIQTITSGERLPLVTDRPQLPFSEAVWKEALRWNTFLPLGSFPFISI